MLTSKRFICTRSIAWFFLAGGIVCAGKVCADQTYDQNNPSQVWDTTTANWDTNTAVWTNLTTNNAIFTGTSETVDVNAAINVGNITFNSGGWNIGDINAPAGSLNFGATSTIAVTNVADTDTISAPITSGSLTTAGAGTLVLSGANTFTGNVVVSSGNLKVTANGALGDTTGITTVANAAALILGNGVTITGETVGLTGSGANSTGALQADTGATATWAGTITIDAQGARVGAGSGGTLILSGVIQNGASNPNGILAIGEAPGAATPGTVIISGTSNTYSGVTQIVRGVLKMGATNALPSTTVVDVSSSTTATEDAVFDLNGFSQNIAGIQRTNTAGAGIITNTGATAATLTINGSGTTTYSGVIRDGTSTISLVKNGTGTQTLTSANAYTGTTLILNGGLAINNNLALGTGTSTINVGGGQLILGNGVNVTGRTITLNGNGTNNDGALQTAVGATATWTGNIIVNSVTRIGAGDNGTLNINGVISGAGGNVLLFSRGMNAVTVLNAVNTYTGDTQLFANSGAGDTLRIGVDNAISASSRLSMIPTQATASMTLDLNGHMLTLRGMDTTVLGGAQVAGSNFLTVANNATGTTSTLTVGDVTSTNTDIFGGVVANGTSGAGGMSLAKINANTQILIGANTYTGSTTVNAGTLQIGATGAGGLTGSLASTSFILNGGTFALNNVGTTNNNTNRISDTASFSLRGGTFSFLGSDQTSTNSSETIGTFSFDSNISKILVTGTSPNSAVVTATQLSHAVNTGIGFVDGVGLGSSSASLVRIMVTNAPTLVGGTDDSGNGINALAQNTKIVPYLLGETGTGTGSVGTATGTANTFVTWSTTGGLRSLNLSDEFTQNAFTAGNNIHVTGSISGINTASINSLIVDPGSTTNITDSLNTGQTLTIASGAIFFSSGNGITIAGGTIAFGSSEGIVTDNAVGVTIIGSAITGTSGLSIYGSAASTLALGGASTYSGNTLLKVGIVVPQVSTTGSAGSPTNGPFGTGTVILGGSSIRATTSTAITIGNPISFAADTTVVSGGADKTLTFTGPVTLTGSRTLTQNSTATTTFSGAISDGGNGFGLTVAGTGTAPLVLGGVNTYTGPTVVKGNTLVVSGSISGSSAVVVGNSASASASAILGGGGTVGNVTVGALASDIGAVLKPHAGSASTSAGTTFHAGSVTFTDSATHLSLQIGRTSAYDGAVESATADGDVSDHLATTGSLTLNGADLQLSLLTGTTYTPVNGDLFFLTINSGGAINGTFSSLNGTATNLSQGSIFTLNSQAYEITYQANFATNSFSGGNDIALEAVIPEPGSLVSLIGGLGCLIGVQRLRRSRGSKAKS
ncbi:autotransporter-associated beta strand repeat protein [Chthoniobacter flavus Ellin428]|uniref:Autotransporter-associated beta strand repeat protein n=1 Tax=Chthoniobacter flavus Ellin428 TaxID=497964 RepID=B4DA01_9BACT|nr:autotransporter-associated beta strand repeat-containing protein [Chthoniobacter flavus]EDY16755.1 autotransporter-associated beta strand repeat protein [Chthoniobacter flavus Ellin428]TCO86722.1 putative secreted protein with PEP-CTERM sorting signal [Chthoniobacter flavus]